MSFHSVRSLQCDETTLHTGRRGEEGVLWGAWCPRPTPVLAIDHLSLPHFCTKVFFPAHSPPVPSPESSRFPWRFAQRILCRRFVPFSAVPPRNDLGIFPPESLRARAGERLHLGSRRGRPLQGEVRNTLLTDETACTATGEPAHIPTRVPICTHTALLCFPTPLQAVRVQSNVYERFSTGVSFCTRSKCDSRSPARSTHSLPFL